jgi:uncharacterized protein with FMN-binding domain
MKKRALLVFTGTVGALGGVFSITPPQFGNSAAGLNSSNSGTTPTPAVSSTPTQSTQAPTPKATKKSTTPTPSQSSAAPDPTPAPPAPTKAATTNATVTGNTYAAHEGGRNWGNVTVRVTFTDGQITAISGTQSPTSRGQWAFDQLDPYVSAQKITVAQIKSKSANALPYVSGVSYSSMAYWESLKSAISKAGL